MRARSYDRPRRISRALAKTGTNSFKQRRPSFADLYNRKKKQTTKICRVTSVGVDFRKYNVRHAWFSESMDSAKNDINPRVVCDGT